IFLIGEKTLGKRVGSNLFGSEEKYGWLLQPIVLRIYNANREADYANGFMPDKEIDELIVGNTLYPFGDTNELLLKEAIQQITGQVKKKKVSSRMNGDESLCAKPFLKMKRIKGLIDDYDNLE
ncbi:MAG: hypothetical protein Q4A54_08840, partial [Parabacteroides sp.]|nr:hypothetical protein [Parabacteroides sp.]